MVELERKLWQKHEKKKEKMHSIEKKKCVL